MPHGEDFDDMKFNEIATNPNLNNKLRNIFSTYSGNAIDTFIEKKNNNCKSIPK